jgi:hypothetical protein
MNVKSIAPSLGLTALETDVLEALIQAHPDHRDLLYDQLGRATVASRRRTGLGFFLNFTVEAEALFEPRNFELNDVYGDLTGLEHGAGFMLFIRGGRIAFLEGHSFDEAWPATEGKHVVFVKSPNRGVVH